MLSKRKEYNYEISQRFKEKAKSDELQIYLEAVGRRLDDSVETGNIITDRATNLLNLSSGLLIALVAYCLQKWQTEPVVDELLKLSLWGCGVLVVISGLLLIAILPKKYCMPGASAQMIFKDVLFADRFNDDQRYRGACFSLIESYENSIQENNDRNKWRMTIYKVALFIMVIAPLCFASIAIR